METTNDQIKKLEAENRDLKAGVQDLTEQLIDLQNAKELADFYKERYDKAFEKLNSLSAENEDLRKKNEDFQTILHEFAMMVKEKREPQKEDCPKSPLCDYIKAVKEKQDNNEEAHWIQHYDSQNGITFECSNCYLTLLSKEKVCPRCNKTMGKTVVHKSCWH
jgi:DNA repair exonuclease SbcCD ATPase subunit